MKHDAEIRFRSLDVGNDAFEEELCRAVRIECSRGATFVQRHFFRHTVNRCRGGKHDVAATVFFHQIEQVERSRHIVVVVEQRLGDGFADGFQPSKVDDGVKFMRFENFFESRVVEQIDFVEFRRLAREFRAALDGFFLRVVKVVDNRDVVACLEQFDDGVRADVAGASGNENSHNIFVLWVN